MAAFLGAMKAMKNNTGITGTDSSSQQHTMTIQSNISQNAGSNKIECPFNLDEIFQSDVERFGSLKDVLKFIIENLNKVNIKINEVDTKMVQKFMQIAE